ncbi:MAG: glutaredoxin 3 [Pseudomonadales bacterium]|nr:glutaredoxin 3 [Gammaproteobacteria bacterium]MCH1557159.1 glutaredoxin 3 [Pseudomonadales bacterium]RPG51660.1 MAG: glutaredoxin 3 [Gammaproteobacteria bacterium TMED182]
MPIVTLYTTRFCPFCVRAKMLLDSKKVEYQEIAVDYDAEQRQTMQRLSGQRTVPQIWIRDQHVGGCDELYQLEREGGLDTLLGVNHE